MHTSELRGTIDAAAANQLRWRGRGFLEAAVAAPTAPLALCSAAAASLSTAAVALSMTDDDDFVGAEGGSKLPPVVACPAVGVELVGVAVVFCFLLFG